MHKELRQGLPWLRLGASNAKGTGLIPDWGTKVPHAFGQKNPKNVKQKQYCNKFSKDLKNGPH